ncbi:hypothetical protein E3C22_00155 [Jiella endophytica]|uniref:Calcineurin-like phosphoesterase domain-containing protein n=1 Tax=Jiella endophytica TaxID=2558362 RepID=A0A4Y8RGG4_9HYPH|nr:metallophosphoesterase [Jiella endophytica]TFF20637.1 hypothetical protein E3C22_17195 [Jiella endophytica]TFF26938.1 hypothetical protein E3C22_00155 [Jiella endophytica]
MMDPKRGASVDWQQLIIVHVSDMHFGEKHRFDPPPGDNGQRGPREGFPKLEESILKDLGSLIRQSSAEGLADPNAFASPANAPVRVIFVLTGDFTETGAETEYDQARRFLSALHGATVFNWRIQSRDIFMVPGNHDVRYSEEHYVDRWHSYCRFYRGHLDALHKEESATALGGGHAPPPAPMYFNEEKPHLLSRVIDQSDQGLIVAEINSSAYVQRGEPGERRGEVDHSSIANLRAGLHELGEAEQGSAIRIALLHHHPVLLPGLAEARRGNDAVGYGDMLLNLLRDEEFQLVLHGHKHVPYIFLFDAELAWATERVRPIVVVAGGSAGSTELPQTDGAKNTYNLISLRWHGPARQARIHIETRGLVLKDSRNQDLPAPEWHWRRLAVDDRVISRPSPSGKDRAYFRPRGDEDQPFEALRAEAIGNCRRNFPAIEVFPTFHPGQGFEARVWIEAQEKQGRDFPVRVEWSAGPYFPKIAVCHVEDDPQFRARFAYYGPMLIQARMYWRDSTYSIAYVFAHYPRRDVEVEGAPQSVRPDWSAFKNRAESAGSLPSTRRCLRRKFPEVQF